MGGNQTAHGHLTHATALPAHDPTDLGDPAPDGHPAITAARIPKKHPEPAGTRDQSSRGGSMMTYRPKVKKSGDWAHPTFRG
ncbi:hypothetical protein GCM10018966_095820 [Streptomyces yanii]